MDTLAQRVKNTRRSKGLTQLELGKQIGVSQNAIQKIENGDTKDPRNILQLSQVLGVDPNWLQFGSSNSGVMISKSKLSHSPVTNNIGSTPPTERINLVQDEPGSNHKHRLDYLDVRIAAGITEFVNSDYPEIISSVWLSDDGMLELVGKRSADGLRIANVPTDSMEPTIPKGSPVIIDTKVNGYIGDGIYVFSINGSLFIKRLQKLIKGGYLVISDNKPKYRDEEMDDEFLDNAVFIGKFIKVWLIETVDL